MIKLRNFFKSFGPKKVLRSLDLDVESGEIVTIRGKNGSGKTCLLYTSPSPRDVEESRMPSSA